MTSYPFAVDYDKRGAAKCKKCKFKIEKGMLRIGKIGTNPFGEGEMKMWHHVDCIFDTFLRARAATKKLEDPEEDLEGWDNIEDDDKKLINDKVKEYLSIAKTPTKKQKATGDCSQTPAKKKQKISDANGSVSQIVTSPLSNKKGVNMGESSANSTKDNLFKEFRRLCATVAETDSYLGKTKIIKEFITNGTDGKSFKGDLKLLLRLLLPGVIKRVYNLQSKQLLKLFSQIFTQNLEEMTEHLELGDVAETIKVFFERSSTITPAKKSLLTLLEVDDFLDKLSNLTQEEPQQYLLKKISIKCTSNDLRMIIRLIKGDLRINSGAKHILEAVHQDAYEAFKTTRNLDSVLDQIFKKDRTVLKMTAEVMTPVQPMLAEACRSVEQAMKKCPNGMYAEIKYDGERVQVHKNGNEFKYFSRSLKPVVPHKVNHFKDFIPKAFPYGKDLILDSEVLLIDTTTGNPLPFGSLGVHKKTQFKDANVCLFVFDCIHYNGEDLMNRSITERRHILKENMEEVQNHVVLSEMKQISQPKDLSNLIAKVLCQGLEGLVLKDLKSIYEPGKRHWLKVKKDYLNDGSMADSADLVVLGAWFGTGRKGGIMSIFLMGCFDSYRKRWCTVTKVHSGFDDAALERLQKELQVNKISRSEELAPSWLHCSKDLIPDFVVTDPYDSPVWEITGAEFTKHDKHTADGISVRFPRVTKERPDKSWKEATDLSRLKELYTKSKEHSDIVGLCSDDDGDILMTSPVKKGSKHQEDNKVNKVTSPLKKESKHQEDNKVTSPLKIESQHLQIDDKLQTDKLNISLAEKEIDNFPKIFDGVILCIPRDLPSADILKRYFIAFGGDDVDKSDQNLTHKIYLPGHKLTKDKCIKVVTHDWLIDSIKLKKRQIEKLYKPNK